MSQYSERVQSLLAISQSVGELGENKDLIYISVEDLAVDRILIVFGLNCVFLLVFPWWWVMCSFKFQNGMDNFYLCSSN